MASHMEAASTAELRKERRRLLERGDEAAHKGGATVAGRFYERAAAYEAELKRRGAKL